MDGGYILWPTSQRYLQDQMNEELKKLSTKPSIHE